jgi:hypothetical protein
MFMREGTPRGFKTMSTGERRRKRACLLGQDARDDALVAVAAGHLVAHVELAFDGHVDLDHLDHARGQVVALGDLGPLLLVDIVDELDLALVVVEPGGHQFVDLLGGEKPGQLAQGQVVEDLAADGVSGLEQDLALLFALDGLGHGFSGHLGPQPLPDRIGQGGHELGLLDVQAGQFELLDGGGALVLVAGTAVEDAHVDDRALDARRHLEGGVFDVPGLVAEDGPKELFLGGELGLALGGDLAHQDVVGTDLGPQADDAALVEVF